MLRFTPRALAELRKILAGRGLEPGRGLRISRHPDPSQGFRYLFEVAPAVAREDRVLDLEDLRVVLDPAAAEALAGYQVDFLDDLLNRGFVFRSPDAGAGSGCGTCTDPGLPV